MSSESTRVPESPQAFLEPNCTLLIADSIGGLMADRSTGLDEEVRESLMLTTNLAAIQHSMRNSGYKTLRFKTAADFLIIGTPLRCRAPAKLNQDQALFRRQCVSRHGGLLPLSLRELSAASAVRSVNRLG